MTIKFTQKNRYISDNQIGESMHARILEDMIFGISFEFRVSDVWVSVPSVNDMPFSVKCTDEEIEQLKTLGFGSGQGIWAATN